MQSQQIEIEVLIDRCRVGERKAQELLYRHLYDFALTVAMRYSRDEADAADIMSHAFVKIFKSINNYDSDKGIFHAWVKRIIINEGLDHIKSRNCFDEVELEKAEPPAVSNLAVQNIAAKELMMQIRKLPPATHAVFIMYVVDGFNHREIAERLHISEGTSKWHLSEARRLLQQNLLTYR
ncbi:MAG TPA: RNA polymerase sigma factor [Chitinophagaceae bacterium]|nr:RNA polymerase sigma factor [Chitinophagaceae bacterium]